MQSLMAKDKEGIGNWMYGFRNRAPGFYRGPLFFINKYFLKPRIRSKDPSFFLRSGKMSKALNKADNIGFKWFNHSFCYELISKKGKNTLDLFITMHLFCHQGRQY